MEMEGNERVLRQWIGELCCPNRCGEEDVVRERPNDDVIEKSGEKQSEITDQRLQHRMQLA